MRSLFLRPVLPVHRRNKRLQLSGTSYARDRLQKRRVQRQLSSKLNGGTRSRRHACGPFIQPEQRAMVSVRPGADSCLPSHIAAVRGRRYAICLWAIGVAPSHCAGDCSFSCLFYLALFVETVACRTRYPAEPSPQNKVEGFSCLPIASLFLA